MFADSLWSLCSVEHVLEQCDVSLTDTSGVQRDDSCTDDNSPQIFRNVVCQWDYFVLRARGCPDTNFYTPSLEACGMNNAGQYCSSMMPLLESFFEDASSQCSNTDTLCENAQQHHRYHWMLLQPMGPQQIHGEIG